MSSKSTTKARARLKKLEERYRKLSATGRKSKTGKDFEREIKYLRLKLGERKTKEIGIKINENVRSVTSSELIELSKQRDRSDCEQGYNLNKVIDKAIEVAENIEAQIAKSQKPTVVKQPVYIDIGGQKVLRPKELTCFKFDSVGVDKPDCKALLAYGDPRVAPRISAKQLLEANKNEQILIVLKKRKKKGDKSNQFLFKVDLKDVLASRKKRLAVAKMLLKENEVNWMREELGGIAPPEILDDKGKPTKEYLDELIKVFLSHLGYESIIKDVTRIIQVLHQNK